MTRAPFFLIDGRLYRWKDILELRRAQLAATEAAQGSQLALFAILRDDRRPLAERTASGGRGPSFPFVRAALRAVAETAPRRGCPLPLPLARRVKS